MAIDSPSDALDEFADDPPEPSFMRIEAALSRIEQQAARVRDAERMTPAGIAERLDRLIVRLRACLAEESGGGRG